MIYTGLFLIELIILFFLSRTITKAFSYLFFFLTKNHQATIKLIAVLFFPGTVVHELAHVIVAGAMLVPFKSIEFIPEIKENGTVKLGSAQIAQCDPFRRALIGFAPILVGITLIVGSLYLIIAKELIALNWWLILLIAYLSFEVGNTMFSSKKDLEGTVEVIAIILAIFVTAYIFLQEKFIHFLIGLFTPEVISVFKTADLFLMLPILIDIAIYLFLKFTVGRRLAF